MKILFVMRHSGYVRNFESTLRALCDRGHRVHLAFQGKVKYAQLDPTDIAAQLSARYKHFSHGEMPVRTDGWGRVGRELRLGLDYLRYLTPEYRDAPKLRERAKREAPQNLLDWTERGYFDWALGRWAVHRWLQALHETIPPDPALEAFITRFAPDVLMLTPLIEPGSPQAEYVRAARALGVRTAFCVASWDNLSNKGLIHGPVDIVTVWNDAMKREAVRLHGVPADRVVVTGAAAFDHWFDWKPSGTREAWCARVGLPAERPYLLYLCSSRFVTPHEVPFVRRWLEALRASSSPRLRETGVLIRPHPQNAEQWDGFDASGLGPVAIWPAAGAAPVDDTTRNDYFDSMHHSVAVVGVNTTAEIESAIVGRPVYSVLAPEFRDTQEGTLHFHHLREVNGGLLHLAKTMDEHLAQLDAAMQSPGAEDERCRRFVEAFVRPHGRQAAATPRLVQAIEALAAAPAPAPAERPRWTGWLYPKLDRLRLQYEHEAATEREARASKEAAKALRLARRQVQEMERRLAAEIQSREGAERALREARDERNTVAGVAAAFIDLGKVKRRHALRAMFDAIPADSFVEMNAATPPRKLDYEHADIYLRVHTRGETFRLRACAKEPFTIRWLHEHVRAGDVLFDIGANVGAYSLVAAMKPGGEAHVYAFEASLATVASLCANVVLNRVTDRVIPMPMALSGRTAMNVFSLRDLDPGAARHVLGHDEPEDGPALYKQPVMMLRLDDARDWFGLPVPNHIKMDVDGGELDVLDGAARTLASPELRSMLVEVSTSLSGEVTDRLAAHGLHLQSKIAVKNKAGEYLVWYGLFSREAPGRTVLDEAVQDADDRDSPDASELAVEEH